MEDHTKYFFLNVFLPVTGVDLQEEDHFLPPSTVQ